MGGKEGRGEDRRGDMRRKETEWKREEERGGYSRIELRRGGKERSKLNNFAMECQTEDNTEGIINKRG